MIKPIDFAMFTGSESENTVNLPIALDGNITPKVYNFSCNLFREIKKNLMSFFKFTKKRNEISCGNHN